MPSNGESVTLTVEFWTEVSKYFNNTPNVIFEIFNEPQDIQANDWRKYAVSITDQIREAQALII